MIYKISTSPYSKQKIFLIQYSHQNQTWEILSFVQPFLFLKLLCQLMESYTTADFLQKWYIPTRAYFCCLCRV